MQSTYRRFKNWTRYVFNSTRGQDLIEYALMTGFLAVAVAAIFPGTLAADISVVMSKVNLALSKVP